MSCFDFNCSATMYPFSVTVNPQSLSNVLSVFSSRGVNVWRAGRSLDHLWLKPARWAKGISAGHIGVDGKPPRTLQPEATIRLGGMYAAYPQHLNVVTEIWSAVTHQLAWAQVNTKSAPNTKLPKQLTKVKCVAAQRSMDVQLTLEPEASSLRGESLDEVILANSLASAGLQTYEAKGPTLFNWFGAVAAEIPTGHVVAPAAAAHAPEATTAAGWAAEKKKLTDRIHELEEKNRQLAAGRK